ncbi:pentatricopeptide repeat-containing protein [Canna indica]|uniref:Pentatricopeptide repeat-containing protein n=1 Tax=Canna indica TaxID=4628 RepID=A0AAQ3Q2S9_9LILI|nr:pentatricopeptide repeat-containing protein [Canna indica]
MRTRVPPLISNGKAVMFPLKTFRPHATSRGSSSWKSMLFRLIEDHQVDEANRLFARIPSPSIQLYTMMINGYSRINRVDQAFRLFDKMPARDTAAWNSMIKTALGIGELDLAWKLFDEMPEQNVISWTTMINGLSQFDQIDAAEDLFLRMPERDTAAWNAMISAYCDSGRVKDACRLFEKMPQPNVISWTALIGGHDQNGQSDRALWLFYQLWMSGMKLTPSTYACVLTACANASELGLGTQLHSNLVRRGYSSDSFVSTSLVNLYAKCKQIEDSIKVFNEKQERDVVSWTALVTGYGMNDMHDNALEEFNKMVAFGIQPNQSTFSSALNSCCGLEALDRGKKIHVTTVKLGLDLDVFVGNSLIVMYSKCGDIDDSLVLFNSMDRRNLVTWNTIIVGCAQNGYTSLALKIFDAMRELNVQPDSITYTGLLTACSHSKMLGRGRHIFHLLQHDSEVAMKLEHFVCMVDILGRCGQLEEAEELIQNMPMEPNTIIWLALLSACRMHANIEVARRTSKKVFEMEPDNSAAYVLLSNIYASAGRWNDVSQIRLMMRCRGIMKVPGSSWITLKETRHEFVCGDRSHPMAMEIYAKLDWLGVKLKELGYVYDTRFALHDVDDEQKEVALAHHSEKLAVAFGLISTVEGSTIRVIKNLRVCGDCHSAIKLISKLVGRRIVLRDSTRFHHFRDGLCSCGDCW